VKSIIIEYNYSPSLTGKLRTVDILIYENFEFRFEIFYHKKPDGRPFDERYYKSLRNHVEINGKLPKKIIYDIEKLLSFKNFKIQRTYPELTEEEKKQYEPNDIGNEYYTFFLNENKYSVNVNPWYFNKKLLKTEQELSFLKFHQNILDWIDETHDNLIREEE